MWAGREKWLWGWWGGRVAVARGAAGRGRARRSTRHQNSASPNGASGHHLHPSLHHAAEDGVDGSKRAGPGLSQNRSGIEISFLGGWGAGRDGGYGTRGTQARRRGRRGRRTVLLLCNPPWARLPLALLGAGEAGGGRRSGPYVLTLIVYERERRAPGSFLAPSARGAASCSSRRFPESLPAQLQPPRSPCSPPVTDGGPDGKEDWDVGQVAGAEGKNAGWAGNRKPAPLAAPGLPARPGRSEPERS